MIRTSPGAWRHAARAAAASLACAFLAACGSGGVTDNTVVNGGPIAITPSTATLYSDLPTTFVVTGGSGTYTVVSSDQSVVPVIGTLKGSSLTISPNQVGADTTVTLTVQDALGAAAPATATLTVKPRTVSNVVTITPSASQSAACGAAVCSGGDAEVKVILQQAGTPLAGRSVRFDVISGDIRIITSDPGAPEIDSLSGTAMTDTSGTARIRVRVLADATSQTALLRITDTASGSSQTTSVAIAPSSNAPLNAQPATIVFQGIDAGTCASGITADVIVFGGRPPYVISRPGSFSVFPTLVTSSGGTFEVGANGQCSSGSDIAIVDANGATVSITASNKLSDLPVVPPTQAFAVSPGSINLATCSDIGNVSLSGGSGSYIGASNNSNLTVTVNNNIGSVKIRSGGTLTSAAKVTFSDGKDTKPVDVTPSTTPLGPC